MAQRNIRLLYTGGTLGMVAGQDGLAPAAGIGRRLGGVVEPPLDVVEIEPVIDSGDAGPALWQRLVDQVREAETAGAPGVIIVHGTDTMGYTAAALALALADVRVPVILTGAQHPLFGADAPDADALANLQGAARMAGRSQAAGVWVWFGGRLLPGVQATKVSTVSAAGFAAPNASAAVNRPVGDQAPRRDDAGLALPGARELLPRFTGYRADASVGVVRVFPGMTADQLARALGRDAGVVLQVFGSGTAPTGTAGFVEALTEATARGQVVLAVSQALIGGVDLTAYAQSSTLARAGVIDGGALTVEAALAALHFGLACGLGPGELASFAAGLV